MAQIVEVPDFGVIEFPDDMTPDEISVRLSQHFKTEPPQPPQYQPETIEPPQYDPEPFSTVSPPQQFQRIDPPQMVAAPSFLEGIGRRVAGRAQFIQQHPIASIASPFGTAIGLARAAAGTQTEQEKIMADAAFFEQMGESPQSALDRSTELHTAFVRGIPSQKGWKPMEAEASDSLLQKGGKGALNAAVGLADFMTSGAGALAAMGGATFAAGAAAPEALTARRALTMGFAADMAKEQPEQLVQLSDAVKAGDWTKATELGLNNLLSYLVQGEAVFHKTPFTRATVRPSPAAIGETIAKLPPGPESAATAIRIMEQAKAAPPAEVPVVPAVSVQPKQEEAPTPPTVAAAEAMRAGVEKRLAAGQSAPTQAEQAAAATAQQVLLQAGEKVKAGSAAVEAAGELKGAQDVQVQKSEAGPVPSVEGVPVEQRAAGQAEAGVAQRGGEGQTPQGEIPLKGGGTSAEETQRLQEVAPEAAAGAPQPAAAPFTRENIKQVFNLTDEQAEATMTLANAMGIDLSRVEVAKGGEPAKGALLSERTLAEHRAEIERASQDKSGMDTREVEAIWPDIERVAEIVRANRKLNTPYDPEASPLSKNQFEKSKAFELNTNCPRRAEYGATINAIEKRLAVVRPEKPILTDDELLAMSLHYQSQGKVAPCIYCYVEAGRRARARVVTQFMDPNGEGSFNDPAKYPERARIMREEGKLPADLPSNPEKYAKDPNYNRLLKEMNVYAQGAAKSKLLRTFNAEYSADWLNMTPEQRAKYPERGPRFSGSNDFVPDQVVDWMQAIVDLSLNKMPAYTYTKQNDVVQIFGRTGMKINQSIGVLLKEGEPWSKAKQDLSNGMDWKTAKANREKFGDNVGVAVVALNDNQVRWALKQPWIDNVLAGHHSGLTREQIDKLGWTNHKAPTIKRLFGDDPNYRKLEVDLRSPETQKPVKPIFDYKAAQESLDRFYKSGGFPAMNRPDMEVVRSEISKAKKGEPLFQEGEQGEKTTAAKLTTVEGVPVGTEFKIADIGSGFTVKIKRVGNYEEARVYDQKGKEAALFEVVVQSKRGKIEVPYVDEAKVKNEFRGLGLYRRTLPILASRYGEIRSNPSGQFSRDAAKAWHSVRAASTPRATPEGRAVYGLSAWRLEGKKNKLQQSAKGSVEFADNGKALIRGLQNPDVSTGIHELAHVARRQLFDRNIPQDKRAGITDREIAVAEQWAGATMGWDKRAEEKFSRGFERYLRDGKAPNATLTSLFNKLAEWLKGIYQQLRGSSINVNVTPEMAAVFDKLVTRNPVRLERAPEGNPTLRGPTAMKYAKLDEDRAARGLDPLVRPESTSDEATLARAIEYIDSHPDAADGLVAEVLKKPRAIEDWENHILLLRRIDLRNAYNEAADRVSELVKARDRDPGVVPEIERLRAQLVDYDKKLQKLEEASGLSGSARGRALRSLQLMMNEDMSLASMMRRKQAARNFEMTPEEYEAELARLKPIADEWKAKNAVLEDKLKTSELRIAAMEADAMVRKMGEAVEQYDPRILAAAENLVRKMEREAESASVRLKDRLAAWRSKGAKLPVKKLFQESEEQEYARLISEAAVVGSAKMGRIRGREAWDMAMKREYGDDIDPMLDDMWVASNRMFEQALKDSPDKVRRAVKRETEKIVKSTEPGPKGPMGEELSKDEILAKIQSKYDKNKLNELSGLTKKLAERLWEEGYKERDALYTALEDTLSPIFPDITRFDVLQMLSGRGKWWKPDQSEVKRAIRDYSAQARLLNHQQAVIARMENPIPPTGMRRDKPTDAQRRETAILNELKKKFGVQVTDAETQLKTALQSAKTYIKNRMADLREEMRTGKRILPSKTPLIDDAELAAMRAEYETLKKDHAALFPRPEITDEQRAQVAIQAINRTIVQLEDQISRGEWYAKRKFRPIPETPALVAARARLDALRDHLQELRDADTATKVLNANLALEDSIIEYERKIAENDLFAKASRAVPESLLDPALVAKRNALRKQLDMLRRAALETKDRVLARSMRMAQEQNAELTRRINEGDIAARTGTRGPTSPELDALRAENAELSKILRQMQTAALPKKSAYEIALQAAKTRMKNSLADYYERIWEGNYEPIPKKEPLQLDEEAINLKSDLEKIKEVFAEEVERDRLRNLKPIEKVWEHTKEVYGLPRRIMSSWDMSALLRQGGIIGWGHPLRSASAARAMFSSLRSMENAKKIDAEIRARPNNTSGLYKRGGLYLAPLETSRISTMEELYAGRWARYIPGLRTSERIFVTFLNKLRADSFDALLASVRVPWREVTTEELQLIGNYVNVTTGRGNMGQAAGAAQALAMAFFSPRLVTSRFQYLLGQPLWKGLYSDIVKGEIKGSLRARKLIAWEYARTFIGLAVMYGLAKMAGAEIEDTPFSSDFGKLKWGNTRQDPAMGLSQVAVLLGRLGWGQKLTASGEYVDLRKKYRGIPLTLLDFMTSKAAPIPSAVLEGLQGKDWEGNEIPLWKTAADRLMPMGVGDFVEALEENGLPKAVAFQIGSTFGVPAQTYQPKLKPLPEYK